MYEASICTIDVWVFESWWIPDPFRYVPIGEIGSELPNKSYSSLRLIKPVTAESDPMLFQGFDIILFSWRYALSGKKIQYKQGLYVWYVRRSRSRSRDVRPRDSLSHRRNCLFAFTTEAHYIRVLRVALFTQRCSKRLKDLYVEAFEISEPIELYVALKVFYSCDSWFCDFWFWGGGACLLTCCVIRWWHWARAPWGTHSSQSSWNYQHIMPRVLWAAR
jgi:hypothetical protein